MLVIRRRTGEVIRIGENVELRVLSIGRSSARLGITAPRTVRIGVKERPVEDATGPENPAILDDLNK